MVAVVQSSFGQGNRTLPSPSTPGNSLLIAVVSRGTFVSPAGYTSSPLGRVDYGTGGNKIGIGAFLKTAVGESSTTGFGIENVVYFAELAGATGFGTCRDDFDDFAGDITNAEVSLAGFGVASGDLAFWLLGNAAAGVLDTGLNGLGWHWSPSDPASGLTSHASSGWPGVLVAEASSDVTPDATFIGQTTVDSPHWASQLITIAGVVTPPAPGPIVGVYDPGDVFIGELTEAYDVQFRVELNATGAGQFKINRRSPEATADFLQPQNIVRVTVPQIDPDPIFAFILEDGDFTLIDSDEEGGEELQFSGRGALSYWERAIWLAQSFLQKWWPQYKEDEAGPPGTNDIGAIALAGDPGWYYHYTVNTTTNTVTGKTRFHTDAVTAYYDDRRLFTRADGSQITLVHLSDTVYAGYWVHPFGAGVRDYRKRNVYAFGPSVLMQNLSTNKRPGEVIYKMWQEAIASDRPVHPLTGMTVDFDDTTDSNGDAWNTTDALAALSSELGDDYLSTIAKILQTGAIDVYMDPSLTMHAYNSYGRDLSGTSFGSGVVLFRRAVNIADQLKRIFADAPVATFAEVQGSEESAIARVTLADPGGRPDREISVRGDTTDLTALAALGDAQLQQRLLHSDTVPFAVDTPIIGAEDPDNGAYLPGPPDSERGNYWIGDVVTLDTGSGVGDFSNTDARVAAITFKWDGALNLMPEVELVSGYGGIPKLGQGNNSTSSGSGSGVGSVDSLQDIFQILDEKDQPQGYPSLDEDGHVPIGELAALPWKAPVRVIATTAQTLASIGVGTVIDGVTLAEGDDFALAAQAAGAENGFYTVPGSGTPARRGDMNSSEEFVGTVFMVREGTTNGGTFWRVTNTTDPTVGTTAIGISQWAIAFSLTVDDEGTPLATAATVLNFVGAGVTASGTGATKTITIPGGAASLTDANIWKPVMASQPNIVTSDGLAVWIPLVTTDGEAIMALVPNS